MDPVILGWTAVVAALVQSEAQVVSILHPIKVVTVVLVYRIIMMEITIIGELVVAAECGPGLHQLQTSQVALEV